MPALLVRLATSSRTAQGMVQMQVPQVGTVSGPAQLVEVQGRVTVVWDLDDYGVRAVVGRAMGRKLDDWQAPAGGGVVVDSIPLRSLLRSIIDGLDGRFIGYRFPGASVPPSPSCQEIGAALHATAMICEPEPRVCLDRGLLFALQQATVSVHGEERLLDPEQKRILCAACTTDGAVNLEAAQVHMVGTSDATIRIEGWDGQWNLDEWVVELDGSAIRCGAELEHREVWITRGDKLDGSEDNPEFFEAIKKKLDRYREKFPKLMALIKMFLQSAVYTFFATTALELIASFEDLYVRLDPAYEPRLTWLPLLAVYGLSAFFLLCAYGIYKMAGLFDRLTAPAAAAPVAAGQGAPSPAHVQDGVMAASLATAAHAASAEPDEEAAVAAASALQPASCGDSGRTAVGQLAPADAQ